MAETGLALYNLKEDIGERDNVLDQYPQVVEKLTRLAEDFKADLEITKRGPGRI